MFFFSHHQVAEALVRPCHHEAASPVVASTANSRLPEPFGRDAFTFALRGNEEMFFTVTTCLALRTVESMDGIGFWFESRTSTPTKNNPATFMPLRLAGILVRLPVASHLGGEATTMASMIDSVTTPSQQKK
jgi:hypothetical protein